MKCQKCGKNETNFHYSSNVNGNVTEAHLCSECASKSGYDFGSMFNTDFGSMFNTGFGSMFNTDRIFGSLLPFNMGRAFLPMPIFGYGMMSPFGAPQGIGTTAGDCDCGEQCEAPEKETTAPEVDAEMQKRREINTIREQMRCAAEKEDYEKAAELRDQIRQMEAE